MNVEITEQKAAKKPTQKSGRNGNTQTSGKYQENEMQH
jgi:hypothetical protein